MTSSPPRRILAYAYVPREDLASVLRSGLMSARQMYEQMPERFEQMMHQKYGDQLEQVKDDDDLRFSFEKFLHERFGCRHVEQVAPIDEYLSYLNWRHEPDERGSEYVYFMLAPIPDCILNDELFIRDRGSLVANSVLVQWEQSFENRIELINNMHPATIDITDSILHYNSLPVSAWQVMWRQALDEGNSDSLWFEGIPHAMVRIWQPVQVAELRR